MAFFETLAMIALITSVVANVAVTVYIAYLTFKDVVSWFRNRQSKINKDSLPFTYQEKLRNGQFKTIQGIFNTRSNEVDEARSINSEAIDSAIRDAHRYDPLIVYK
ncbi:MAG TPA: hypothetical protein DDW51_02965 [Cyanobacteria bacterium UBA11367]|nr:hypothetical protein [Cyanobacteria bacterium UBA11367]